MGSEESNTEVPVRRLVMFVAACATALCFVAASRAVDGGPSPQRVHETAADQAVSTRFAGAGTWRDVEDKSATARGWRIHALQRSDGGVQAKLSVPGVPELDGAAVEAQVIGSEAFGVLLDEKGAQIATFNATLWGEGAGGSFVMGNGQSGTWGYDATTKAEVVRLEALAEPEAEALPAGAARDGPR